MHVLLGVEFVLALREDDSVALRPHPRSISTTQNACVCELLFLHRSRVIELLSLYFVFVLLKYCKRGNSTHSDCVAIYTAISHGTLCSVLFFVVEIV